MNMSMNTDFPRIITLLRKERGLSQRTAAKDLGISQALLSHYEKGVRECGLDFLVKIAGYYNVSCDYLLGITPQRNGATISVEDIPDYKENEKESKSGKNMLAALNKKLIINTAGVIFDMLAENGDKNLTALVGDYLQNTSYCIFRKLYSANESNPQAMFSVDKSVYAGFGKALGNIQETNIDIMLQKKKDKTSMKSSPESIGKSYPDQASSLFNLIQNAEKNIKTML